MKKKDMKISLIKDTSLFSTSTKEINKKAICVLTFRPDEKLVQLYDDIDKSNYDLYMIIDDNQFDTNYFKSKYPNIQFVQIKEEDCIQNGYYKLNYYIKNGVPSAWEKAIYYFCEFKINDYQYVWFLEDDVFVPNEKTINSIDMKVRDLNIDFLSKSFNNFNEKWDHSEPVLKEAPKFIINKLKSSLICVVRLSNKFLQIIKDYVKENKHMFFVESFFPTLANYYNLNTYQPEEFSKIVFKKNWSIQDIEKFSNYFFHPVKDINQQVYFRKFFKPNIKYYILNNESIFKKELKDNNLISFEGYHFIQRIGFINKNQPNKYLIIIQNNYEYFLENIDIFFNSKKEKQLFFSRIKINTIEEGVSTAVNLGFKYDFFQNMITENYLIEKYNSSIKIINLPGMIPFVQFESYSSDNLDKIIELFIDNKNLININNYFQLFLYSGQLFGSNYNPFSNFEFKKLIKSLKYVKKNKDKYIKLTKDQDELYNLVLEYLKKINNKQIKIRSSNNFVEI